MRAFGWLWAASLALAGCAAPPPIPAEGAAQRVASLNLCTDELLLLLAAPDQIASVTHLSASEAETPLAERARSYPSNDGTLTDAMAQRPNLVLTMGGGGDKLGIAERVGIRLVSLPFPQSIDDVVASIRTVAAALGRGVQGEALVARIAALRRSAPKAGIDTLWVGGGGRTVSADGLQAQWLAVAGYRQREVDGGMILLEDLLMSPPAVLVRSDYRDGQYSRGQAWLQHPLAGAREASREVVADGRRWTCLGPLLIEEIERLRRERAA